MCLLAASGVRAQPEAAAPPEAGGQAETSPAREGYLAHRVDGEIQGLVFFRITDDGFLMLREGTDETAPTVTLPSITARTIIEQMNRELGESASSDRERLGVDLLGNTLWVRWAKQMSVLWVLAAGLLAGLALAAFVVWLRFRRKQTELQRLAESRAHLAAGQEAERGRLAHELHDGPLQDLHGIKMQFGALRQALPGPAAATEPAEASSAPADTTHDTEVLEEDLVTVIAELRAIMSDLHPPALRPFGLAAALRGHLKRFRLRYPALACDFASDDAPLDLSQETRLVLFRVCQEALSNAAKHAHASRVEVSLRAERGRAVLRVADDGRGFTEAERQAFPEQGSFGLSNMAARAEAIGADLEIDSVPGQGTTITVTAPLDGGTPAPRPLRFIRRRARRTPASTPQAA